MVHALQEIWRVLVPDGCLIDLRPRATNWALEVVLDGQAMRAGQVDNTPFFADDNAAERAIKSVVHEGWFSLEHLTTFECASYWDTLEVMLTYYAGVANPSFIVPESVLATARRLAATVQLESKVRTLTSMDMGRYRKIALKA